MKIERATLHMALACYSATNPDKQILMLARRYKRMTKSARTKKTMGVILNSHMPSLLVRKVYEEIYG